MVAQLLWDHNCIFLHIFPTTGASQLYVVANVQQNLQAPRFAPVLRR
jgi:hypothetical protein